MNIETYSESAEGVMIDRARGLRECRMHGLCSEDTALCLDEVFGDCDLVDAAILLQWLGY